MNAGGKETSPIQGGKLNNIVQKESLTSDVTTRRIDVFHDREAIAGITAIYNQKDVIEHLCGFAPEGIEKSIDDFRQNIAKYLPEKFLARLSEEALKFWSKNLVLASPEGIQNLFIESNKNCEVYVAETKGKVVGTAMLNKRVVDAMFCCTLGKVAVSTEVRGKGIASKLLETVNDRIDLFGFTNVGFTVIKDVEGTETALNFYLKHGYSINKIAPVIEELDIAWDFKSGKYKLRDVYALSRSNHTPNTQLIIDAFNRALREGKI